MDQIRVSLLQEHVLNAVHEGLEARGDNVFADGATKESLNSGLATISQGSSINSAHPAAGMGLKASTCSSPFGDQTYEEPVAP